MLAVETLQGSGQFGTLVLQAGLRQLGERFRIAVAVGVTPKMLNSMDFIERTSR